MWYGAFFFEPAASGGKTLAISPHPPTGRDNRSAAYCARHIPVHSCHNISEQFQLYVQHGWLL